MAAPISAKSASWRAVAPTLAPRSSTMQVPDTVGHCPAMAGRSMPGMVVQDELGHGHQGAGVAGRDHEVGFALVHGIERQPHAGRAAAAHRLARLVLHLHDRYRYARCAIARRGRDAARDAARCASGRRSSRKFTSGWRSSAMAAPGTTTAGPSSPPMASSDIVRGAAMSSPCFTGSRPGRRAAGRTGPQTAAPENDRP